MNNTSSNKIATITVTVEAGAVGASAITTIATITVLNYVTLYELNSINSRKLLKFVHSNDIRYTHTLTYTHTPSQSKQI